MKYDFTGRGATYGVRCTDGTRILSGAFRHNDGKVVPLVWMHQHDEPSNVLGKALIEYTPEGPQVYASLNSTEKAQDVKSMIEHGDVDSLSIWANHLKRDGGDIYDGDIKEVSLVLAGADPTARIQATNIIHSDEYGYDEAEIFSGEEIVRTPGEVIVHADRLRNKENDVAANNEEMSYEDVFNTLTPEQKDLFYAVVAEAENGGSDDVDDEVEHSDFDEYEDYEDYDEYEDDDDYEDEDGEYEDDDEDGEYYEDEDGEYYYDDEVAHSDEGDNDDMKYNVFEGESNDRDYISHSEQASIIDAAKKPNMTFQGALEDYLDSFGIAHDDMADAVAGFDDTKKVFDNRTSLNLMFPDYQEALGNMPELITSDQGWITTVLAKVKKAPYSRVRTSQVDIRNIDELRAKGYQKGNKKALSGNYALIRRTTDPQTVYVRSSLNRDDIVDITDFDYVQYQYNIDKLMLNEEVATAIMLGDNRTDDAPDKIFPSHIRPIWTDDELYVKHVTVDIEKARKELQGTDTSKHFSDNYVYAEAIIEALLHARETDFRGTGTPDFFCTPALMNKMLLSRDLNGRRIYSSKAELQSALNIGNMITAEQFTGKVRTDDKGKKHKLLGIVGNLADYQVGSTKGGEISHFTQFDIDFNQEKSLIETRLSGAVVRIYSFIVLEEDVADTASNTNTAAAG